MIKLKPFWEYELPVPEVWVDVRRDSRCLSFTFDVKEHPDCYRKTWDKDGDPCWQDSCVEVFIQSRALGEYFNFETNPSGVTLAEFGEGREHRKQFSPEDYRRLNRSVLMDSVMLDDGRIHWSVRIDIPLDLLHLGPDEAVVGNLYKCASHASKPVYLLLYPIDTPKPDYHQPAFFGRLLSEA